MTSRKVEIPLNPNAQKLSIELAGVTYNLFVRWNTFAGVWVLDISDSSNIMILAGIPIVANTDLLEQYGYLNFGGKLVAWSDGDPDLPPTYENLGTIGHLYFLTIP